MDTEIENAIKADTIIDITTIGKKTGKAHKIEIAFHNFDGALYISGLPGKRDWYANLVAQPEFIFHLKQSTQADIPAKAVPITDDAMRKRVLTKVVAKWGRQTELQAFLKSSPLVEVKLAGR